MIDWFASKMGIVLFITAAIASLILFTASQLNIMDQSLSVETANDISRIADEICEGCSFTYDMGRTFNVTVTEHTVRVNSANRTFLSDAAPSQAVSDRVRIYRQGGIVHVQEV